MVSGSGTSGKFRICIYPSGSGVVSKEKAGGAAEPMNTPVCAVTRMVTKINLAGLRVLGN